MSFLFPARESPYDIELNSAGYVFAKNPDDSIMWSDEPVPEVAGKNPSLIAEERSWDTWHLGAGHGERLWSGTYHSASGMDLRFPRQAILGPRFTATTTEQVVITAVKLGTVVYGIAMSATSAFVYSYAYNTSTGGFTETFITGTTITGNPVPTQALVFDGLAYICFSTSHYLRSFDGTTLTPSADTYAIWAAIGWSDTAWRFARAFNDGSGNTVNVAWCSQGANPLVAGNYGATYVVGDLTTDITGLAYWQDLLMVAKEDGLYALEGNGQSRRVLDVGCVNANNGKGIYVSPNGWVYYPSIAGLYRYNPGSGDIQDCTPGRNLGQVGGIAGRVAYLSQYRSWLFALVQATTGFGLWAARARESDEPGFGPLIWHGSLVPLTAYTSRGMLIDTGTTPPSLLAWADAFPSAGKFIYGMCLPRNSDNPLDDSSYAYRTTAGTLRLPTDDWDMPGGYWQLRKVVLDTTSVTATRTVVVKCSRDDAAAATLATITAANRQVTNISTSALFSRAYFQLELTAEAATTPVIRSLAASASRRVPTNRLIRTTLLCDDRARDHFGNPLGRSGAEMVTELEALHDDAPVSLIDWLTGASRSRTVLVAPVREVTLYQRQLQAAVTGVEVEMLVVA